MSYLKRIFFSIYCVLLRFCYILKDRVAAKIVLKFFRSASSKTLGTIALYHASTFFAIVAILQPIFCPKNRAKEINFIKPYFCSKFTKQEQHKITSKNPKNHNKRCVEQRFSNCVPRVSSKCFAE